MKKLEIEDIRHLGKLSMIPLSPEDERRAFDEINSILAFFASVTEFGGKQAPGKEGAPYGRKDGSCAGDLGVAEGIASAFPRKEKGALIVPRSE